MIDLDAALTWCDQWLDPDASLLWNPQGSYDELAPPRSLHLVPQSGWYAAGVLAARGDAARAAAVFDRLCTLQYDLPGTRWHGTFARFAETPVPSRGAVEWVDYDPNWRQFLGTTFALTLSARDGALAGALPPATVARMRAAIALAIDGEPPDRVAPTYSNIALMRAWLEVEHADDAPRRGAAESYAADVIAAFDAFGAFEEYNSPTYYGIDLYALGLWARHSSSALLRNEGARVEAALWRDIARWWHAGMANLCGPWSRSYGMDMGSYAALVGLFVGGRAFPDVSPGGAPFEHSHDTTFAPMVDLVDARAGIPDDVRAALSSSLGDVERLVEQRVTGARTATGWVAASVMLGGEAGGPFPARGQYHPATAHWLAPDGQRVGWLRVRHESPVDAVAEPGRLVVDARGVGAATVLVGGVATDDSGVPLAVEVDGRRVDVTDERKVRIADAGRVVVTAE